MDEKLTQKIISGIRRKLDKHSNAAIADIKERKTHFLDHSINLDKFVE
jgi:hypothetical protein